MRKKYFFFDIFKIKIKHILGVSHSDYHRFGKCFNLFYGKINVFISIEGKEYSNSTLSSTSLFNLETTDLKEFCQEKNQTETFVKACGISINVTNVNALSSQYLLVIKRPGVTQHLSPGTARTQGIVSGE